MRTSTFLSLAFLVVCAFPGPVMAGASSPAAPVPHHHIHLGSPAGVALDGAGNLYVADARNARIDKLSSSGKLLAQWGVWGTGRGQLEYPGSLALDSRGNLYVLDEGKWSILKFSSDGRFLAEWGGPLWRPLGSTLLYLSHPAGITIDARDDIYIADTGDNRIVKIAADGKLLTQWAMKGRRPGAFQSPMGVAVDSGGNIYVADSLNFRIQKLSPSGRPLAQWSTGTSIPAALTLDAAGNLYAVDLSYYRVLKISPRGAVLAHWGTWGAGPRQFARPVALVAGGAQRGPGNVYIADLDNERVVERSPDGRVLAIWK